MVALAVGCAQSSLVLFGALNIAGSKQAWFAKDWTGFNDSSVGGRSTSTFAIPTTNEHIIHLEGYLDSPKPQYKANMGIAGQRTTSESTVWDLSEFDGIEISYSGGDNHNYTLSMKDVLPTVLRNGRERSTIDWVHTFTAEKQPNPELGLQSPITTPVFISWKDFKPTYHHHPVENAHPLNTTHIRSFSIMIRSSDNQQTGEYSVLLHSISAAHAGTIYHLESVIC